MSVLPISQFLLLILLFAGKLRKRNVLHKSKRQTMQITFETPQSISIAFLLNKQRVFLQFLNGYIFLDFPKFDPILNNFPRFEASAHSTNATSVPHFSSRLFARLTNSKCPTSKAGRWNWQKTLHPMQWMNFLFGFISFVINRFIKIL